MKALRWPLLISICLVALLSLGLVLSHAAPVRTATRPVAAAPLTPMTCTTHTTGMTLTLDPLKPRVGDTFAATATLANEGCALIGVPQYTLWLGNGPNSVLTATSPMIVNHSLGLGYGESDAVTFTLKAIGGGTTEINVFASFEVHTDLGAYWAADSTGPAIVSVPFIESLVLQRAAEELGCADAVIVEGGDHYSFDCVVAAGHSLEGRIERFADAVAAQAAFSARQGTMTLEPFHCYPAYTWAQTLNLLLRESVHSWLADRWIITARTVDDTPLYPPPLRVSEAIYTAAIHERLLRACDVIYLPVVQK